MPREARVKSAARLKLLLTLTLSIATFRSLAQGAVAAPAQSDAAFSLEQQGRYEEAETAWQAVLKAHPASADANAHLGFLEARQEHYKEAVPFYRRALALNPSMPGLKLNLGLALFKAGELKEAIQTFTSLLKDTPASSSDAQRLNTLIGMAHYGLGEYAEAVPYLKKVAAADPRDLHYRLVLAHSCLAAHEYPCVLDVYHEILTLNAESAEADMLAGEALDAMRNHGGAIEQFRAAVKADPKEPNVHFGLAYLLWTQNQFDEATPEFQAELSNAPGNAEAMTLLADCDIHNGQPEAARALIETAIQLNTGIERAHLDLGILNADGGKRDEALREFKTAARLSPGDPDVHWRLARLYQAMGRKEEAKVEFDKTSSLHKAENESVFSELKAAQEKGRPAEGSDSTPATQ